MPFDRAALKPGQYIALEMTLELAHADRGRLEAASRRLRDQGIRLTNLAALLETDSDAASRVHALHDECHRRQPPAQAGRAPIPYHLWAWGSLDARGEALPDAYFIAVDGEGRYVGLSSAVAMPRLPGVLLSRLTGVAAGYERRGIASALKAETVLYAIANGYREMRSTVLADNAAMLRINESFGFVPRREIVQSFPHLMTTPLFQT
jgi:GNAT superfamily N-acetyltransferase